MNVYVNVLVDGRTIWFNSSIGSTVQSGSTVLVAQWDGLDREAHWPGSLKWAWLLTLAEAILGGIRVERLLLIINDDMIEYGSVVSQTLKISRENSGPHWLACTQDENSVR